MLHMYKKKKKWKLNENYEKPSCDIPIGVKNLRDQSLKLIEYWDNRTTNFSPYSGFPPFSAIGFHNYWLWNLQGTETVEEFRDITRMSTIDTGSYHLIWWHHNLNGFREFLSMAEVLSILYKYQNVSNICLLRSRSTRDVKLHGFGRTISLCLLSSLLSTVSAKYTVGKRNFVVLGTTLYFNWCNTFIWFFKCQSSTVTGLIE